MQIVHDQQETLYCEQENLTSLPQLSPTLGALICWGNRLDQLPSLPINLTVLHCNGNRLTSLLPLPKSLKYLYCANNNLKFLPPLPEMLQKLVCDQNYLAYTNLTEYRNYIRIMKAIKLRKIQRWWRKTLINRKIRLKAEINRAIEFKPHLGIEWFNFLEQVQIYHDNYLISIN